MTVALLIVRTEFLQYILNTIDIAGY